MPDIVTGIITSDYQVRTRWGFTGFENAFWDRSKFQELLFPNMRVDVRHRRKKTISGFMLALEDFIAPDYSRRRPKLVAGEKQWTIEKFPMNYVIATFLIPEATPVKEYLDVTLKTMKTVGFSIEHGGRKPKRTIGPLVTLCDRPRNKDCWAIFGKIDGKDYDKLYPKDLAPSIISNAKRQFHSILETIEKSDA